jgi:hypothetical protein
MRQTAFERAVIALMHASGRTWQIGAAGPSFQEIADYSQRVRAVLSAIREPDAETIEAAGVKLKQYGAWGFDPADDKRSACATEGGGSWKVATYTPSQLARLP